MKILVIQQKMIGDVLTSSLIFEILRKAYPQAELHYLIHKNTAAVIENNPFIDKIIYYKPEEMKSPFRFIPFLREIRDERYDAVIDVYSKIATGLISLLSNAPIRTSFKKSYTKTFYTHTYNHKIQPTTSAGLAVERRLLLLKPLLKQAPEIVKPKIYLTEKEIHEAKELVLAAGINLDKPVVMISVLGSSKSKTYPLPYMAKLLDEIVKTTNAQILFNYIPNQKEEVIKLYELCTIETQERIFVDLYAKSLRGFIALTSHCKALIGNEGGAINMAKALEVPTFAIFSPQIKKENWSLFEDGKTNVSVHLKDFKPELFKDRPQKEIALNSGELYKELKPELIFNYLNEFLKITHLS